MRFFFLLMLGFAIFTLSAPAADFSPRQAELARAKHEKTSDRGKRYLTVKTAAPHNPG